MNGVAYFRAYAPSHLEFVAAPHAVLRCFHAVHSFVPAPVKHSHMRL